MESTDRRYKWDNLKAVLILLVVFGHFVAQLVDKYENMRILYFYIYIFHMPMFLYVSVMFSRKTIQTGKNLKKKVVGYVFLGYLLRFVILLVKLLFGHFSEFRMWKEHGLTWYLFALAVYILITRLLRQLSGSFLLSVALIASCFAGYDTSIGGNFILARLFVFYPFFLLGYYSDYRTDWKIPRENLWRIAAVIVLAVSFLVVYRNISFLYGCRDLIKGWKSYKNLPNMEFGALYRLAYYAWAWLMCAAVIVLMPERRTPLSVLGERTIQIYLWHRPILYVLVYLHWEKQLAAIWPAHWKILYLSVGLVLALVLSLEIFGRPIARFWKALDKL